MRWKCCWPWIQYYAEISNLILRAAHEQKPKRIGEIRTNKKKNAFEKLQLKGQLF